MLHGNETSGFYALQKLLQHYQGQTLPRSVSIFIGNVKATEAGCAKAGGTGGLTIVSGQVPISHYLAEAHMAQQVTDIMRQRNVMASIDIHNNTGKNPHYACINKLESAFVSLAGMFSNTLVYFTTPKGVQSAAFAEMCPSVTIECGLSGQRDGVEHAFRYLQTIMHLGHFQLAMESGFSLYHTVARVKIPQDYSFGFADDATINLLPEIENYNFCELDAQTPIAKIEPGSSAFLQAFDDDEREVGREYFEYQGDTIVLRKPMMPAMLTTNTHIIRQDCLCYLMERISSDCIE